MIFKIVTNPENKKMQPLTITSQKLFKADIFTGTVYRGVKKKTLKSNFRAPENLSNLFDARSFN